MKKSHCVINMMDMCMHGCCMPMACCAPEAHRFSTSKGKCYTA